MMAKEIYIDPNALRAPGTVRFGDIPVNRYQRRMRDVRNEYSNEELKTIFADMLRIREFETMMQDLRINGSYNGVAYNYTGPAHLCIGQEAACVGQAFVLTRDDAIFGTHRGHGELIAKGMSVIRKLSDEELLRIMDESAGGAQRNVIREHLKTSNARQMAMYFYLYGIMSEIFGRINGFAKGLGNSMHAFFIPFGIYPNNAIVGGSAPIAAGAALYKKLRREKGIVVANAGDGAVGCGPVWEAMNFAGMDQYDQLWQNKGGLPIIFNFINNGYGMGGQTCGETMSYGVLARIGAGINPQQMHAERIDGYNVFAVIDAFRRQKALLERGKGPALLDIVSYRQCGHSTSDANPNRTREEIDAWKEQDSIKDYACQLIENNVMTSEEIDQMRSDVRRFNFEVFCLATDERISPRMDLFQEPRAIEKYVFSNLHISSMAKDTPVVIGAKEDNSRVQQLSKRSRSGIRDGKKLPSASVIQIRDAIFEAILDKFYEDPTFISFGEDLRVWGSAYGVYKKLEESVPYERLFNSAISESAIIGASVGYAMMGGRVCSELMYCDFLGRAGDEVFNQLAKWQAMTAGQVKMPVVVRMGVGSKYGAQHSQDWSSLCAHVPGLKIVYPVTPYDAKGLMNTALSGSDPVIFLESQSLYGQGELFHKGGVPKGYYEIPIGESDFKRRGSELTIMTFGPTLYRALEAAEIFENLYGISVEVIDARSIVPFDYETLIESVRKTGKCIIASDACQRGSFMNDIAANLSSMAFDWLDAPVQVLGARNWITPVYELEKEYFPQADWFVDIFHEMIQPISGYTPKRTFTVAEQIRRGKWGV